MMKLESSTGEAAAAWPDDDLSDETHCDSHFEPGIDRLLRTVISLDDKLGCVT